MNVGEYGNYLRVNANEDISSANNTLTLRSPTPVSKTKIIDLTNGLLVGVSTVSTPEGDFLPNQYVEYRIRPGDIFISGDWEVRLKSQSDDEEEYRITDKISYFRVDP